MSRYLAILSLCILCFLPFGINNARTAQEQTADSLSPQLLRFHVIANSNTPEDQQLKLEIRSLLLNLITEDISEEYKTNCPGRLPSASPKENLIFYIKNSAHRLEDRTETYMREMGFPYTCQILLTREYFPTKQYETLTYPNGTYDAVKVILGEGKGRNWWCALYPPLAFSDAVTAEELPEKSSELLLTLIPETDYSWMTRRKTIVFGNVPVSDNQNAPVTVRLRFKALEWLRQP